MAGPIERAPEIKTSGRHTLTIVYLRDETGSLQVNWFHMPFLRSTLRRGSLYVFRGKVAEKNGRRIMEHPEIFTPAQYGELEGRLQPVYALTAGLSGKTVARAVRQALEKGCPGEYLSEEIRAEYGSAAFQKPWKISIFPKTARLWRRPGGGWYSMNFCFSCWGFTG